MAKKKSKTKETVILIRIPDMDTRQGAGTLTIQRDDLGHMHQFSYTGLTVRGNIAEALKTALVEITKLEAAPPPTFATANDSATPAASEDEHPDEAQNTEEDEIDPKPTDNTDKTDTDDISTEGEEPTAASEDEVELVTPLPSITVPTAGGCGTASTNQAQMSLI